MAMRSLVKYGVLLCFFASGATGLIYEVIWAKYLTLFIGNTTYTHTIVIATFMGGLALGSFLIGKSIDRMRRPLKFYGYLEVSIALYAIIFPKLLTLFESAYFSLVVGKNVGLVLAVGAKLMLSLGLMLLPTLLMGGTLPVLSRVFARSFEQVGHTVSLLYFINSLGAVFGTVAAGFIFIVSFGLPGTVYLAAITNAVLGLIAISLDFAEHTMEQREAKSAASAAVSEEVASESGVVADKAAARGPYSLTPDLLRLAIIGICLSGFSSMIYELVWIRLFGVVLGSSTHSFSLMLAAFISGLALGSLIVARWMPTRERALWWFGLLEILIAVAVLLGFPLYPRLPYYFAHLVHTFAPTEIGYLLFQFSKYLFCFFIMFVPTIAFGATLPIVSTVCNTELARVGRQIGNVYSINTLGTLFGAFLAGLVLIPYIGLKGSLQVAVLINLLIGVLVIMRMGRMTQPRARVAMAGAVSLIVGYIIFMPPWETEAFISQIHNRSVEPPESYSKFINERKNSMEVLYYDEGTNANVAVYSRNNHLSMSTNGKTDGSTGLSDMYTQTLLSQVPMLLHPDPQNIFVLGLGTGVTVGSVLTHPVKEVDCAEITDGVIKGAAYFRQYNYNALDDPRMKLHIDDGKSFLRASKKKYDVIISEPSNVWRAGIGNLFSIEYFQEANSHLAPGGIMCQWFHGYDMSDEGLLVILRTFRQVFPYVYLFRSPESEPDYICIGSGSPIEPDFNALRARMQRSQIKADLGRLNINSLTHFLSFQVLGPGKVNQIMTEGPINSDYFPYLEYRAPKAHFFNTYVEILRNNDERLSPTGDLLLTHYLRQYRPDVAESLELIRMMQRGSKEDKRFAAAVLDSLMAQPGQDQAVKLQLAELALQLERREEGLRLLEQLITEHPDNLDYLSLYGRQQILRARERFAVFGNWDFSAGLRPLERCIELAQTNRDLYLAQLADGYAIAGRYDLAFKNYEQAIEYRRANPAGSARSVLSDETLLLGLANTSYQLADLERSRRYLQALLQLNPNSEPALALLKRVGGRE